MVTKRTVLLIITGIGIQPEIAEYILAALATKCRQRKKLCHENMAHRDMVLATTESADSFPSSLLRAGEYTLLRIQEARTSILVPAC